MFHGGTNFGFTAGANYFDSTNYQPVITSYGKFGLRCNAYVMGGNSVFIIERVISLPIFSCYGVNYKIVKKKKNY